MAEEAWNVDHSVLTLPRQRVKLGPCPESTSTQRYRCT
jgi:hypothetical protein